MRNFTSIVLILIIFINLSSSSSQKFKDCNFTDLRFQSKYSLGKQDQLNKTFELMQDKTKLQDILYSANSWTKYNISGINPRFTYYDSKQKAQIMNNDTIIIDGSSLEVTFNLKWIRSDFLFTEGTAQVKCKSDQILFSKKLYIQKGFVLYHLEDYYNVTFKQNQCVIQRYEPADTLQTDLDIIKMMLNQLPNGKPTVKLQLQAQIAKKYSYYLNNSLYNDKHQLDDHMVYQYKYPNSNHTFPIQYQIVPTGVHLNKQGISFNFVTEIKNWDDWTCGATIPYQNKDIQVYGGLQQFISLSVFQNTLKYGIQQGLINTDLNRQNWQSNTFQFFAGDLYEIIPYIYKNFAARQQILGNCRTLADNVSIKAEDSLNQLFVKTTHNCELYIRKSNKILDFAVRLTSHVQTKFEQNAKVNFYIKDFDFDVTYYEKPNYNISNYDWANYMLKSALNRIKGMKVFGSGWPIFDMDYPHFKVMSEGYVFFYDTSMIGSFDQ